MKRTLILFALAALCAPSMIHAHPHAADDPLINVPHTDEAYVTPETKAPTTSGRRAAEIYFRSRAQRQNTNRYLTRRGEQRAYTWNPYRYNLERCWVRVGDTVQHITSVDNENLCRTNEHEVLENRINWVGKYDPELFEGQVYGREALDEPYKERVKNGFRLGRNAYISHESGIVAKRKPHQMKTSNPEGRHAQRTWRNSYNGEMSGLLKLLRYRGLRK